MTPPEGIECGPQRMVKALARTPRSLAALIPGALLALALGGCSLKHPTANLVSGKQMFVAKCGSCHTLGHAGTTGAVAQDVAAYVGLVAGRSGQDTGALATAIPSVSSKPAVEKDGVVEINADPTGQLKFTAPSASATAGKVTIRMQNMSSVMHDIAITGGGVNMIGPIVDNGGVSTVTASLKPGTYTFYCSVDDHREAGMEGKLTVK